MSSFLDAGKETAAGRQALHKSHLRGAEGRKKADTAAGLVPVAESPLLTTVVVIFDLTILNLVAVHCLKQDAWMAPMDPLQAQTAIKGSLIGS